MVLFVVVANFCGIGTPTISISIYLLVSLNAELERGAKNWLPGAAWMDFHTPVTIDRRDTPWLRFMKICIRFETVYLKWVYHYIRPVSEKHVIFLLLPVKQVFFFFFRHILVISFFLQFFGVILWKISWNCQESATFNNINSERERKARGDCGGQKCWLLPMAMLVSSCDSSQIDNTPLDPPGAESLWFWVQLKGVARRRRA